MFIENLGWLLGATPGVFFSAKLTVVCSHFRGSASPEVGGICGLVPPNPRGSRGPPGWRLLLEWLPSEEALWDSVFGKKERGPRESEVAVEGNAGVLEH